MSALNCAAVIAAALILFPSTTAGQTNSGELSGVVLDASGGVLPGATVTATHPASGTVVTRVTDAEGRFFLPALRVGRVGRDGRARRILAADAHRRSCSRSARR